MVLQVEDCIDCLKVLYPQYDFLFLFDHSCGHDRGQTDGLNAKRMAVSFGGKQQRMHATTIEADEGYLGPHRHSSVLSVGEEQKMVWPVYSNEEFNKDKHGPFRGWEGEAKGLLQVLWERGWIDPARPKNWYKKHGSKDDTDAVIPESNLQEIMMNCLDFEEEKTLLQKMVENMCDRPGQFFLDRTPKCHCEMAGEGIEHAWGCAKNTDRCRKFSRRARRYMGAYLAIKDDVKAVADSGMSDAEAVAIDPTLIKVRGRFFIY